MYRMSPRPYTLECIKQTVVSKRTVAHESVYTLVNVDKPVLQGTQCQLLNARGTSSERNYAQITQVITHLPHSMQQIHALLFLEM